MTNEEPGYGRYKDKDADPRGFWEHEEYGWRWCASENDPDPGAWQTWEDVQPWGPFTPIGDLTDTSAPDANLELRAKALECASRLSFTVPEHVIEAARTFETYLRGE